MSMRTPRQRTRPCYPLVVVPFIVLSCSTGEVKPGHQGQQDGATPVCEP